MVIYGGELFSPLASQHLGLIVPAPPLSWLPELPEPLRKRPIALHSRREAGAYPDRVFFKPADDKWFAAGVYASGAALPLAAEAVVDIGEIAGADLAVVEANPAQKSALYGADPDAVLTVLAALFAVT